MGLTNCYVVLWDRCIQHVWSAPFSLRCFEFMDRFMFPYKCKQIEDHLSKLLNKEEMDSQLDRRRVVFGGKYFDEASVLPLSDV